MRKLISVSLGVVFLFGALALGSQSGLAFAGGRPSNKEWRKSEYRSDHHKRRRHRRRHRRWEHAGLRSK